MNYELIQLNVADAVATVTLNRPDKRNAMSDDMRTEFIDALGIVDRQASAETLVADAQAWARELSSASSTALALTKTILNQSFELSSHDVFAQGSQAQGICYTSSEHRASVEAFLAKTAAKE